MTNMSVTNRCYLGGLRFLVSTWDGWMVFVAIWLVGWSRANLTLMLVHGLVNMLVTGFLMLTNISIWKFKIPIVLYHCQLKSAVMRFAFNSFWRWRRTSALPTQFQSQAYGRECQRDCEPIKCLLWPIHQSWNHSLDRCVFCRLKFVELGKTIMLRIVSKCLSWNPYLSRNTLNAFNVMDW